MKWLMHLVLVLTVGILALRSASADEADRLIEQLGGKNFTQRQQATKQILAKGPKVLPALKKAVKNTKDPEVLARLKAIIDELDFSDWSPVVNGLRVHVKASDAKVKFGERFSITITLWNTSKEDIELAAGQTGGGHAFGSGNRLSFFNDKGDQIYVKTGLGFCGVGSKTIIEKISAGEKKRFVVPCTWGRNKVEMYDRALEKNVTKEMDVLRCHDANYPTGPGKVTVKFDYQHQGPVMVRGEVELKAGLEKPKNVWAGRLQPPPISIELLK